MDMTSVKTLYTLTTSILVISEVQGQIYWRHLCFIWILTSVKYFIFYLDIFKLYFILENRTCYYALLLNINKSVNNYTINFI